MKIIQHTKMRILIGALLIGVLLAAFLVTAPATTQAQSTVNVSVCLQNSASVGLSGGSVTYAAGSWYSFGTTGAGGCVSGNVPTSTSKFRVTYSGTAAEQAVAGLTNGQIINFQTIQVQVQLLDSSSNPLSGGSASYASGSWYSFGTTDGSGLASKELFPGTYTFKMVYAGTSKEQSKTVSSGDALVSFQTIQVQVELKSSTNNPLSGGSASYASGS